ncbi:MAG: glycosyltransferase family 4 protein [Algiphilus sp.]
MLIHLLCVLGVSAAVCATLVSGRRLHINITGDHLGRGSHKTHEGIVPRVGGIAVLMGTLAGLALATPHLYPSAATSLWVLVSGSFLIFGVGLIEDLTHAVLPGLRYVACLFGALLVSLANGAFGVTSTGIDWIDGLLAITAFSVLFFVFAVAGVTHAFNLIDGQNGLCAGYSVITLVALGLAAGLTGQATIAVLCEILIAANIGFLVFNFPKGRLFLGDAGAYLNGALIAMLTVMVVEEAGHASPWFAVTVLIYPITETFFTIFRRMRSGKPFYVADCHHLHHLVARHLHRRGNRLEKSPSIVSLGLSAPVVLSAPFLAGNTTGLIILSLAYIFSYSAIYHRLSQNERFYEAVEHAGAPE